MGHLEYSFSFLILSPLNFYLNFYCTLWAVFLNVSLLSLIWYSGALGHLSNVPFKFYCNFFLLLFHVCNNLYFWGSLLWLVSLIYFYVFSLFPISVLLSAFDVTGFLIYVKYLKECLAHRIHSVKGRYYFLVNGPGERGNGGRVTNLCK